MARTGRYLWRACEAAGLASGIRRAYLTGWTALNGPRYRVRVGDHEASFEITSWIEFRRLTTLHGERGILASLLAELTGTEVVWDVGANVGMYACFLARALPSGLVVGIEPEQANARRLDSNLRANAAPDRWRTVRVALSDRDGEGHLATEHQPPDRPPVGAGHHFLKENGPIHVTRRRGERLVQDGTPAPDVMKIDVQGAELDVLRGMGESLSSVDLLYLEVHTEKCRRYGTTAETIERFLRDAGFSLTNLGEPDWRREGVYYLRAAR